MITWQMSRFIARTALFAACLGGLIVQAQTAWVPVDPGPKVNADLRAAILQNGNGYQVYFKNFGTTTIHFGFYLEGSQTTNSVSVNRRIHMKPGNVVGPLSIKPEAGGKGATKLHAVEVVEGAVDASAQ